MHEMYARLHQGPRCRKAGSRATGATDKDFERTKTGAGEEIRTLDPHVGNVMLYH